MLPLRTFALVSTALLATAPASPSRETGRLPAGPPRCGTAEYRQLDFWVGEWDVTMGGQPAGINRITIEEDGCLIHEHWTGVEGGTGQSFNFYNREDGNWHQVWVSSTGNVLNLSGRYADGTLMSPQPGAAPANPSPTSSAPTGNEH